MKRTEKGKTKARRQVIEEGVVKVGAPYRFEIVNRKSKSVSFRECVFDEVSKQNQNKREMQANNNGELRPSGRPKLCTYARIHDDISTPGGRWAFRGGGGVPNVDAPGPTR